MTFSQIPYQRADLAQWKTMVEDLTRRFLAAKTFEEADAVFYEAEVADVEYATMTALAHIRRDIDTRDAFYDAETTFYDAEMPKLQPAFKAWTQATLDSPFRQQLEEKYGNVPFLNADIATKTFSPAIVENLQKENALTTRYSKLIASAQIPFRGEVLTLSQLSPWKQHPDDEIRKEAWIAEGNWYNEHGAELDEIYDGLLPDGAQLLRTGRCGQFPHRGAEVSGSGGQKAILSTGTAPGTGIPHELCRCSPAFPLR